MTTKTFWRAAGLVLTLAILTGAVFFLQHQENRRFLGVPVRQSLSTSLRDQSLAVDLQFFGEPAAVDEASSTVYLPIDSSSGLTGLLTSPNCSLTFQPDPFLSDLPRALRENHRFLLLARTDDGSCREFQVCLTDLPVISLRGAVTHQDEEEREVSSGRVCLWDPNNPDAGKPTVTSAGASWHGRGHSTFHMPKKSLKLNIQDENGHKKAIAFHGLGKDDDWILNAMSRDDLKLRERVSTSLWNSIGSSWNYPMAANTYAEVVINGCYQGLYLIQRRLDPKYLELPEEAVFILSDRSYGPSPEQKDRAEAILDSIRDKADYSAIDLRNWIDIELFFEFTRAIDNRGHYFRNNMGYVVFPDSNQVFYVPWDTDVIWGIQISSSTGFRYDPTTANRDEGLHRVESAGLHALYPGLDRKLALRWNALRQDVLSRENIQAVIDAASRELSSGGGLIRDKALWGDQYGGQDSLEALGLYIQKRLEWMDLQYARYLP